MGSLGRRAPTASCEPSARKRGSIAAGAAKCSMLPAQVELPWQCCVTPPCMGRAAVVSNPLPVHIPFLQAGVSRVHPVCPTAPAGRPVQWRPAVQRRHCQAMRHLEQHCCQCGRATAGTGRQCKPDGCQPDQHSVLQATAGNQQRRPIQRRHSRHCCRLRSGGDSSRGQQLGGGAAAPRSTSSGSRRLRCREGP